MEDNVKVLCKPRNSVEVLVNTKDKVVTPLLHHYLSVKEQRSPLFLTFPTSAHLFHIRDFSGHVDLNGDQMYSARHRHKSPGNKTRNFF